MAFWIMLIALVWLGLPTKPSMSNDFSTFTQWAMWTVPQEPFFPRFMFAMFSVVVSAGLWGFLHGCLEEKRISMHQRWIQALTLLFSFSCIANLWTLGVLFWYKSWPTFMFVFLLATCLCSIQVHGTAKIRAMARASADGKRSTGQMKVVRFRGIR